ncbi:MAG: glycosyltransferase [Candidatus Peribacteria bacterium]|nr:glycosyltransferase [Candidatus Peribacteria bacterium]
MPNVPGKSNGSYVRNFGMKQARTELIQFFDDDNGIYEEYLERAVRYYDEQKKQARGGEVVICSSLYYRDTGELQNQGFKKFRYWQ